MAVHRPRPDGEDRPDRGAGALPRGRGLLPEGL
ncbi:hypothetical protein Sros_8477 [Streptosporangium roseum DSM 43021]|uniref:Uncharacterized protein n=1 Tax=Streptosporangium roseum (strain ATCC 12428 / DSM 43021 / JCM 3005 / KCTC 9067 / NCIMB 10171 / NRRL 2505 / NI 9100) TaxID=479432 RepID=D2B295_STRRD|nr:hypothetical protein Sros_8477 [Streptosporangium roseum DSM 43021]